jgi:hypothetical protein
MLFHVMLRRECGGLTMVDIVFKGWPRKVSLKCKGWKKFIKKNKASVMLTCWLVRSGVFVGSGLDVVIGWIGWHGQDGCHLTSWGDADTTM